MGPLLSKHNWNEGGSQWGSLSRETMALTGVKLSFYAAIALISGLSNEIPCIFVAQETAKVPKVNVGGLWKNFANRPIRGELVRPGFKSQIFFSHLQLWSLVALPPLWGTRLLSTSLESLNRVVHFIYCPLTHHESWQPQGFLII